MKRSICLWTRFGILIDKKCERFLWEGFSEFGQALLSFLVPLMLAVTNTVYLSPVLLLGLSGSALLAERLALRSPMPRLQAFARLCVALLGRSRVIRTHPVPAPMWWDPEVNSPLPSPSGAGLQRPLCFHQHRLLHCLALLHRSA